MKKLNKASIFISKVLEIVFWVSSACSLISAVLFALGSDFAEKHIGSALGNTELSEMGFTISSTTGDALPRGAYLIFTITIFFINVAFAMIFRNVHLIMQITNGRKSPFQPDNIRMIREIGIFFIAIAVIEFVVSVLTSLILGEGVESSTDFYLVFMGMIVICLSQYFDYGMKLQNDVDGLI